jgi:signal transduction histidine kinase
VITPLWDSDVVAILLAGGILAAAAVRLRVPGELERATRAPGATAAGVFALVLAGSAAARLVADAADVREPTLLVYELTLCAIAVGLLLGLDRGERARAAVADLVVDLGEQPGTLRDALARALGDPSLEIGFWLPGEQAYVNADGRPLEPPDPESGQRVTELAQAGAPVAVLVHDPAVLDEPELVEALAAAARLAAANAELQASVRGQVAEVAASRRRLVRAGAEERHRLEERLHAGAQRRLEALRESLEESRRRAAISEIEEPIAQAQEQLERALAELRELAAGLHPLALAERGLRDALRELAVRFPLAVDVAAPAARFPIEVEATVYFVCSEALANAAKHAEASRVWIDVADRRESLTVRISDDGRGGANTSSGSGLRGLIDRVEALGGRLEISSPPDRGTVLSAAIPLTATPSGQA